ncbi:MAG: hypothetical protein EA385_12920 [Salinarimonadaceae bacterium]|nr:MAG: hypothetical protein EA385_12920 [Salinarimonadaceae bacterium]
MAGAHGFRAGLTGVQNQRAAQASAAREDEDRQYQRGRDARSDELAERRARAYEIGQTRRAPGASNDTFLSEQRMQSAINSYAQRLGITELRSQLADPMLRDEDRRADIEAQLEAAEAALSTYEQSLMEKAAMNRAQSGAPAAGSGGDEGAAMIAQAREAIEQGADPDAVRARLVEMGHDPSALGI